jgi:MoaA/NifB/PqqE/SkfB family radical SAM enzyme
MQSDNDTTPLPSVFALETVCGCNLHCVECAVGGGLVARPAGLLRLEDFRRALAAIRPYCNYLFLHLWGEPMLHPHIFTMIEESSFCRTNISTNAQTLDAEMARRLVASGVSEVIVSIDGMTQEVYAHYRHGGVLAKTLAGLDHLVEANARAGNPVRIMPQFIVFEHNEHQLESFREHCAARGLIPSLKAPYLRPGSRLRPSALPGLSRVRLPRPERVQAMRGCPNISNTMTILRDGSAVACCYDHNGGMRFGNIFRQSVAEVWNGGEYRDFRQRLAQGVPPAFCLEQCLLY